MATQKVRRHCGFEGGILAPFQGGDGLDVIPRVGCPGLACCGASSDEPQGGRRSTSPSRGCLLAVSWSTMALGGVKVKKTGHVMPCGRRPHQQFRG